MKNKNKKVLIFIGALFLSSFVSNFNNSNSINITQKSDLKMLEVDPLVSFVNESISIGEDADIIDLNLQGDGSIGNPYIIRDLIFEPDGEFGISIEDTTVYIKIVNCTFNSNYFTGSGIRVRDTTAGGISIQYCNFTYCDTGVLFDNLVGSSSVENCFFISTVDCIEQEGSGYAISVEDCQFLNIYNGISLDQISSITIIDSNFENVSNIAVSMDDITAATISTTNFSQCLFGISDNFGDLTLEGNIFDKCSYGVYGYELSNVIITQNNFTHSLVWLIDVLDLTYTLNWHNYSFDLSPYPTCNIGLFEDVLIFSCTNNQFFGEQENSEIGFEIVGTEDLTVNDNEFDRVALRLDVQENFHFNRNNFSVRGLDMDYNGNLWMDSVKTFSDNYLDDLPVVFQNNSIPPHYNESIGQLYLFNCSDSVIEDIDLYSLDSGISCVLSNNITLRNITALETYCGMIFESCDDIFLDKCNLTGIMSETYFSDKGIKFELCENISISNSYLLYFDEGMNLKRNQNLSIYNIILNESTDFGLNLISCSNLSISECNLIESSILISENCQGYLTSNYFLNCFLETYWKGECLILDNIFEFGGYKPKFGSAIDYSKSHISNNTVNGKPIYIGINEVLMTYNESVYGQMIFINCSYIDLVSISITNTYGAIILKECSNISIISNVFHFNQEPIYFENCEYSSVSNSLFYGTKSIGIGIKDSNHIDILNCTIENGVKSINCDSSQLICIENCTLSSSGTGIYISYTSAGGILNNFISNMTDYGINTHFGYDLKIEDNWVQNCSLAGMLILSSFKLQILWNIVTNNQDLGVKISDGTGVVIFNNFIFCNGDNSFDNQLDITTPDSVDYNINQIGPDGDYDSDGLTDEQEIVIFGTDPSLIDSDGDGYLDGYEINQNTDPLDQNDYPQLKNSTSSSETDNNSSTSTETSSNTNSNGDPLGIPSEYFLIGSSGIMIITIIVLIIGKKKVK
ncbi:right-handed parallel beta-helix repeat-containing protein [Candidatus Lokiarchaeum ossiferum]|uniref:right-handed parallel beta-helix repeat-containing protein n=1 Tax=Candidatus Lokiarchaeum ossiferum TaxID=2951803 RepID=UPI00352CF7BA